MTPMTPETPGPVIDPIVSPVIGVDFSGAKQDSSTWMATGVLTPNGLHVNDIRSLTRADLLDALRSAASSPEPSVASLDFPFSVPQPFAQVLARQPPSHGRRLGRRRRYDHGAISSPSATTS